MAGSSFGNFLTLSTFGESHGVAIGGILDNVPAGFSIDLVELQKFVSRRKPGQSRITTQRKEEDEFTLLSGVFEGVTTGTPIGFMVMNGDAKSKDYDHMKDHFRPSHADYTFQQKFGIRDHRGGGRSSARETLARVIAGGIALQILAQQGIVVRAHVDQVGSIKVYANEQIQWDKVDENLVRCGQPEKAALMQELIEQIKKQGDTIGGGIYAEVLNAPVGLGEPVFDKLHALLGHAMLSINAVKGFEIGSGFNAIEMKGSEHNDLYNSDGSTKSNNNGGLQGGISNGMPIQFRVAFKPVATLQQDQEFLSKEGELTTMKGKGRHDPCVVPRAVPIVEAMTALVILDCLLMQRARTF